MIGFGQRNELSLAGWCEDCADRSVAENMAYSSYH